VCSIGPCVKYPVLKVLSQGTFTHAEVSILVWSDKEG
jgi:hypothetical protein